MSKCRTYKCHASCCKNVPLPVGFIDRFADKVVNPVTSRQIMPPSRNVPERSELPWTSRDTRTNKCPFLRADCKCNIYDCRPTICRVFGEGDNPLLRCRWRE